MYRATTATHTFELPIQTSSCAEVLITYKQYEKELNKHYENGVFPDGMEFYRNDVIQHLTQEEVNTFCKGIVDAQIRVRTNDNKVHSSQVFHIRWDDVLNDAVLS